MNIYIKHTAIKAYIAIILLILIPISAFSKSDFRVAYQIDDQIISNYDIDQARKLRILLSNSNISRSEVETIVINEKIKEIYANRLKITVLDTELKSQLASFLKSNKMSVGELKSLMNSKGIDTETFYNFIESNIRWKKVLDSRFGYKINNLALQDAMPEAPTPKKIEKEYVFSEIFISFEQWGVQNANLIASRLAIELKAGADFDKAVEKFSSAKSKATKGKIGPIRKTQIPKEFRDVLDRLKRNEISAPIEINGGLILLRLEQTRSYKSVKTPRLSVTFSISSNKSNSDTVCSKEEEIRGPILLTKVDKNLREILTKLMPGESYNFSKNNGSTRRVTLCERFINEKQNKALSFENIKKNEEALRLSNALMLELRRNTTIVKK
ncbi:MAG: hypothetical protein CM15mP98_07330 [Paracoccaceae bacterium]|nr:MAG: hypothetical protein CM15mP98_07330 [Paracoccaceae bacterium]